jgi:DNA-binding CsgD family transcriptional regulator
MDTVVLGSHGSRGNRGDASHLGARAERVGSVARSASKTDYGIGMPDPVFLFGESVAKVVTDEKGRILWSSPGAEAVTADNSCVTIENGELSGRTRYSDSILREVVSAIDKVDHPVDQLIAAAIEDGPQLFVRAQAVPSNGFRLKSFTIRRLDRDVSHIPDLHRLYGLTRTEQQIVKQMIQGQSVSEIAAEIHKSVLTVRTHVKRIYSKLHVGSKEQLFSTLMKLMVD